MAGLEAGNRKTRSGRNGLARRMVRGIRERRLNARGFEVYQLGTPVQVNGKPHRVVAFKIDEEGKRHMGVLDEENYQAVAFLLEDIKESRKLSTPLYDMFNGDLALEEQGIWEYVDSKTRFFPFGAVQSEENRMKEMRGKKATSARKYKRRLSEAENRVKENGAFPNVYGGRI